MFFDNILLKSQHRGQFGKAWLAATIGVNKISKKDLVQIDILKLCEHLINYMISESTSPKKRFSLRLSVLLINGTLKIYRQQVLILEDEVIRALQIVHIPSGIRSLPAEVSATFFESPLTPIAKVKTKKRSKKHVLTPVSQIPQVAAFTEQVASFPEVEDILAQQPRSSSDLITLREELPKQAVCEESDNFGLQSALTVEELQELGLMPEVSRPPEKPTSLVSSDPTSPHIIQAVAQVHAEKGTFEPSPEAPPSKKKRMPIVSEEIPSELPIEEGLPIAVTEAPIISSAPARETPLRELQLGEVKKVPEKVISVESEKEEEAEPVKRSVVYRNKVIFSRVKRRYIQINRYNKDEGIFVDESVPSPDINKNKTNARLIRRIVPQDGGITEQILQSRAVSLKLSLESSGRLTSTSRRRSTLERDAARGMESLPADQASLERLRQSSIGGQVIPAQKETPTLRPGDESDVMIQRPTDIESLSEISKVQIVQPVLEIPVEQPLPIDEVPVETIAPVTELEEIPQTIFFQTQDLPITSTPRVERLPTETQKKTTISSGCK